MFFVFGGTLDPNFEKSPNARVSGEWPLLQGPVLMIFRLGFPGSRAYCFTSGISAKGFGVRIQVAKRTGQIYTNPHSLCVTSVLLCPLPYFT